MCILIKKFRKGIQIKSNTYLKYILSQTSDTQKIVYCDII